MAIETVSFPIGNGDFPVRYVKLPEGTSHTWIYIAHVDLRHTLPVRILSHMWDLYTWIYHQI